MAKTKFTAENRAVIVAQLRAGVPLAGICRDLGVRLKSAEGWLTRGRREESGDYADFVEAVEQARTVHERASLSRDAFDKHLAKAVRGGSVQAMKLWWEINGKPGDEDPTGETDPGDAFDKLDDELAPRRKARGA